MDIPSIIGLAGGSFSLGQATLQFLGVVRKIAGADVIAAYFSATGTRLHGDEVIEVQVHTSNDGADIWWFQVTDIAEYSFTRLAVGADAAIEQFGAQVGAKNVDPRYWRWIGPVLPGRIHGGGVPSNALVEFVVLGYKPKALIAHFSSKQK